MKRILNLIFILIAAVACKEVFEAPPQALLKATLLNSITSGSDTSAVTARGIGLDSLLYNDSTLTFLALPLSTKDTSIYIISFDSKIDTITFIHETTLTYASMETGFYYEHKLRKILYSQNRINSIEISDSSVTKTWHENITINLRPLSSGSN